MSARSSKKGDPVAGALAAASAVSYSDTRSKQSFPALRTIIFFGLLGLVLCLSLVYLANPSLTTEYAGHAASMVNDFKDMLLSAEDTDDDGEGGPRTADASVDKTKVMNAIAAERAAELNYSGFDPATTKYKEGHVRLADFDFIWQKPSPGTTPAGVVLLLHTCGKPANTWFTKSRLCPDCIGLPMQASITNALVKEGFAVASMSPVATINTTQCWTMKDRKYLISALTYIYNAMNRAPTTLPLYGLATENGALFISTNARVIGNRFGFEMSAFCLMNVGVGGAAEVAGFPPTVFVDMEKNAVAVKRNKAVVEKLTAGGTDAVHYVSKSRPMSETFFMPALPEPQSKAFYAALVKEKIIGAQNRTLLKDPMKFVNHKAIVEVGKKAAPRFIPARDTIRGAASAIQQQLNVAWGYKEVNDEFITQTIEFFKKHNKNGGSIVKPKLAPKPEPIDAKSKPKPPPPPTDQLVKPTPAKAKPVPKSAAKRFLR